MAESRFRDAIEKAFVRRFQRWRSYALALTGNWTDAEEVVQEAIARTVRARPSLADEREAHNYMLTALRTTALGLFYERRHLRVVADVEEIGRSRHGGVLAEASPDPLGRLLESEAVEAEQELAARAVAALRRLRPEHRQVVELLVLREPPLRLREVAAIQGVAISTVHSRLQSALRWLGRSLREEPADPPAGASRGDSPAAWGRDSDP